MEHDNLHMIFAGLNVDFNSASFDPLGIITRTADDLSGSTNVDDLGISWNRQIAGF